MKTIHIKSNEPGLIVEIYNLFLKDDPDFHFFYEPEIIIRVSVKEIKNRIINFLDKNIISYEEYEYPFPPKGKYGEIEGDVVANNLNLLIPVFHSNSIAALTFTDDDFIKYLERITHTASNSRGLNHIKEGILLTNLASIKLGIHGILKVFSGKS